MVLYPNPKHMLQTAFIYHKTVHSNTFSLEMFNLLPMISAIRSLLSGWDSMAVKQSRAWGRQRPENDSIHRVALYKKMWLITANSLLNKVVQSFSTQGHTGFFLLFFPLMIKHPHLDIYLPYLFLISKFVSWSKTSQCYKHIKKKKEEIRKGANMFSHHRMSHVVSDLVNCVPMILAKQLEKQLTT